jgi:hypothetical protein
VFWIGGGAMVAIVGVLVVILLHDSNASGGGVENDNPSSAFLEGFYKDENNIGYIPGMPMAKPDPNAQSGGDPTKPRTARPRQPRPVIAGTDPGTGRRPDTENLDDPTAGSVSDRDAEEILDAQKRFGAGLKWCFERALKTNPDLKGRGNRYDVQITITAAGAVRSASVAGGDRDLKECVRQKVSTWSFKAARGDFTTQFPIVFN